MTYCLSDIHGEILKWRDMLKLIQFSDEDTMYVLGDVIDRNPHGIEILQDIMKRPNIHMIIGNHEDMMLKTLGKHNEYHARRLWQQNGGGSTYREMVYGVTPEERNQILQYVRGKQNSLGNSVTTLYRLVNDRLEAIEFVVKDKKDYVDVPLKNLKLRSGILIASIIRGNEHIIPRGDDCLKVNDSVVVISTSKGFHDLSNIFD